MKIINIETGAILEASDKIAQGYLQNPSFMACLEKAPAKKAGNGKPKKER